MSLYAAGSIPIGRPMPSGIKPIAVRNGFGVYPRIAQDGSVSYLIARIPEKHCLDAFSPGSAVAPFPDLESAQSTLNRWAEDPPLPRQPRKPKAALDAHRRNGNRPKFKGDGPGQMYLALELLVREDR